MNDENYWWQLLDSEAEEWEAEFQLRKAMQSGLQTTQDTLHNEQEKTA